MEQVILQKLTYERDKMHYTVLFAVGTNSTCLDLETKCQVCTRCNYIVIHVSFLIVLFSSGSVHIVVIFSSNNYDPHMEIEHLFFTRVFAGYERRNSFQMYN